MNEKLRTALKDVLHTLGIVVFGLLWLLGIGFVVSSEQLRFTLVSLTFGGVYIGWWVIGEKRRPAVGYPGKSVGRWLFTLLGLQWAVWGIAVPKVVDESRLGSMFGLGAGLFVMVPGLLVTTAWYLKRQRQEETQERVEHPGDS